MVRQRKQSPNNTASKLKIENPAMENISSFRKEYIWGFTQGNPMRHSTDKQAFYDLIHLLTGDNATVTIGASFHPYQLLDKSGKDIWTTLYEVIEANKYCDLDELIQTKYFFHMNPPPANAFPIQKWQDTRLFHEVNPEFGKLVPFVIPYLTHNNGKQPVWLDKLHDGITTKGNAHDFITEVNQASRFIMPEPTFIIGFEEFFVNNPHKLVSHYVDFLEKHVKGVK